MRKGITWWVILCVWLTLSTCATIADVPNDSSLRFVENVPFFPQEGSRCGPSSLATVLNYHGLHVTPDEVAREVFSESANGTLSIDMVFYVQRMGLSAVQLKGSMAGLRQNIDRGYPLIVMVDYGFSLYQKNHFMVVKGYGDRGIVVNSGKSENRFIQEKDFLDVWRKAGFWTLLITRQ